MTADEAHALVRAALSQIAPDVDIDEAGGNADLRDDLELDSMDFLGFVEPLSTGSGRRIEESDYSKLATIDCVAFLSSAG